jgi:hypothetical protein
MLRSFNQKRFTTSDLQSITKQIRSNTQAAKFKNAFINRDGNIQIGQRALVSVEQVKPTIEREYKQSYFGMNKLYSQISAKFFGITQSDVSSFLANSTEYQVHKTQARIPRVKSRVVKDVGNIWQLDLLVFHQISILTCVDLFSGMLRAQILRDKTAKDITRAFKLMTRTEQPKSVQTDNGGEFKAQFATHLESEGIHQIFGLAGNPTSQASVERINGTLRRALEHRLTTIGSWRTWLPVFVKTYNETKQTTTRFAPEHIESKATEREKEKIITIRKQNAQKVVEHNSKLSELNVGDSVRIKILRKGGLVKSGLVNFSSEVFTVEKVRMKSSQFPDYMVSKKYYPRDYLLKVEKGSNTFQPYDAVPVPNIQERTQRGPRRTTRLS